jgi:hypothetical protein
MVRRRQHLFPETRKRRIVIPVHTVKWYQLVAPRVIGFGPRSFRSRFAFLTTANLPVFIAVLTKLSNVKLRQTLSDPWGHLQIFVLKCFWFPMVRMTKSSPPSTLHIEHEYRAQFSPLPHDLFLPFSLTFQSLEGRVPLQILDP